MHHHGYAWVGEKKVFDNESIRRPPLEHAPPVGAEEALRERYRNAVADFPATGVPPVQTAHWLMKPASMVRGTWEEPKEAGEWLGLQLAEFAPRFAGEADREVTRLVLLVKAAVERLAWGGDVSLGHYLKGTVFHSVALVTCSPNRSGPDLVCPVGEAASGRPG
ncbi:MULTISPECIES: hypothetical protein [Streptomyces]|uniref:hypothetical protein n=1 Tax=Streptomyces TaxID=1883 RepID=UPI00081BC078|nr:MULTISPECIES: hypothetical protein [unclassified Streptomyces]MYQ53215.1 hypothetical protein [Streptomyces sp. SID4941]SCE00331.1 hypothetical protein GA0115247_120117 [Streptomyces sp. PalvLS-984]SDE31167.1 hypothetical protein F558DRAFT_06009 [Streptomyces sp. AmelKG-A3]